MLNDARTVWQLLRGQSNASSQAARLQQFYAPQAAHYDSFRERLLPGRRDLMERLRFMPGEHVVELGAGTGRNLDFYAARIPSLRSVTLVDLCPALLAQARKRAAQWSNVEVIEIEADDYRAPTPIDCIYFSYSLTMMPTWSSVLPHALRLLRPGGRIGVVDFYVSAPPPPTGMREHSRFTRKFWPWWFAHDGVHLSFQHLAWLRAHTECVHLCEGMASVPYLPGLRVPYYAYIGSRT